MTEIEGVCALAGVDYDVLTEADVAFVKDTMEKAGAVIEVDGSEFYIDDPDDE